MKRTTVKRKTKVERHNHGRLGFLLISPQWLTIQRWEFIKENKKVRKQEKKEKKNSTKKATKKKRTRQRKRSRKQENKQENKNSSKKKIKNFHFS